MTRPSKFARRLSVLMAVAFAIRVAYVLIVLRVDEFGGDAFYYHRQANHLADGDGFIEPLQRELLGVETPSAYHPPLFALVLAAVSLAGGRDTLSHQLVSVVMGTATVGVLGHVGRRLWSTSAGLSVALIAALHPGLWVSDGLLMSETPFALLVAAAFLAVVLLAESPSWRRAVVLGAVLGLLSLTRGEGVVFAAVLLGAAVSVGLSTVPLRERVRVVALAGGVMTLVVAPWIARNLLTFEHPVLLSTNAGATIGAANCPTTYSGVTTGYFDFSCWDQPNPEDESIADRYWRSRGLAYARAHASELPRVALARVGRVWSAYKPLQMVELDILEGRRWPIGAIGLAVYYWLVPLGLVGAIALRSKRRLWPLTVPFPVVTLLAVAFYGVTRFRVSAEVALTVLGGIGIAVMLELARRQEVPAPWSKHST